MLGFICEILYVCRHVHFSRERLITFIRLSKALVTQSRLRTSGHFQLLVCNTMRKIEDIIEFLNKVKIIRMFFILGLCLFDIFGIKNSFYL